MSKLLTTIVVAAALLVAPAAQAIPDMGVNDSAAQAGNPLTQLRVAEAEAASMSPDDRTYSRNPALETETGAVYGGSNNQRAPDFWNYDPKTGEKIANTSPGLSADELAENYSVPIVTVHDSGGFAWDNAAEGAVVGFGFALLLAGLAQMIARSRRVVPA
jgi:hypothetical protein